jgi:hypothetical protein
MTKDDIIRTAQEAGWSGIYSQWVSPIEREHLTVPVTMGQIERFATLVAAAEREACAKVCDAECNPAPNEGHVSSYQAGCYITAEFLAAAIRARGQHAN